jgi:hypothetical protein
MATKENKMHIERENLSVLVKMTQVSDVAHGPLFYHPRHPHSIDTCSWNKLELLNTLLFNQ